MEVLDRGEDIPVSLDAVAARQRAVRDLAQHGMREVVLHVGRKAHRYQYFSGNRLAQGGLGGGRRQA